MLWGTIVMNYDSEWNRKYVLLYTVNAIDINVSNATEMESNCDKIVKMKWKNKFVSISISKVTTTTTTTAQYIRDYLNKQKCHIS